MNEKLEFSFITSYYINGLVKEMLVFSNKLENIILWIQSLFRLNKVLKR